MKEPSSPTSESVTFILNTKISSLVSSPPPSIQRFFSGPALENIRLPHSASPWSSCKQTSRHKETLLTCFRISHFHLFTPISSVSPPPSFFLSALQDYNLPRRISEPHLWPQNLLYSSHQNTKNEMPSLHVSSTSKLVT